MPPWVARDDLLTDDRPRLECNAAILGSLDADPLLELADLWQQLRRRGRDARHLEKDGRPLLLVVRVVEHWLGRISVERPS
eukprot:7137789-Prymnesium_polylepis.2